MTPTWVVILVGLTSGALGSLVTAGVTASHERAAEFRSKLLNAADEFSIAAIVALQKARNAAGRIREDKSPLVDPTGRFKPDIQSELDAANDAVDDLFAKQARIHLLFGDESPASIAGAGTTAHLRNILMALEHRPDSIHNHGALLMYSRNFTGTQDLHEKFNLAALVVLQETWWDRVRERWQLRRRSKRES
jgi:hypothetical protein